MVGLWPLMLLAGALRGAVLLDDLPGYEAAMVAHLQTVAAAAGQTLETLDAVALADPARFSRQRFDLLVVPHSPVWPGAASGNVEAFLRAGGHLALLGGRAYEQPVLQHAGRWLDQAGCAAAVAAQPAEHVVLGGGPADLRSWRRGTNQPEHPSRLVAGQGPRGDCLRLEIADLGAWQWDMVGAAWPRAVPADQDLLLLEVRGGEATPTMLLELAEQDGSRWKVDIPLTTAWRRVAIQTRQFTFFKDGPPAARGGDGDRLHLERVTRVNWGLATDGSGQLRGHHRIELAELATTRHRLAFTASDCRVPNAVCFDDYEPYDLSAAVGVATCADQDYVTARDWDGALAGWSAVGFTLWDRSQLLPLLRAVDPRDRTVGWAASLLVHYGGAYAGGCWLLSGVTTPEFYRSRTFDACFAGYLRAVAERDLPTVCKATNEQRVARRIALTTAPPPGVRRDGGRFVRSDGRPLFLIGANHIGSLDRKFFGGPWAQWLDEDFRRAHEAGLNCLRIYGASAFWRDPAKLAQLRECARRYGIYLLIVVNDHADHATRATLEERCRQVAAAFRDEPMVLGYDLQNEPYAFRLADLKDGEQSLGQRYPLWRRWDEYTTWAGLQMEGNFTSFPGVRGPLPRDAEHGPLLDATSGIFQDWIAWQIAAIRAVDPTHPISVGFNTIFACLPAAAQLDFVSYHAYQSPTSHAEVLRNLTTLDRLQAVWPDRPITLGEFGYTNGLALPGGYLDLHTSALGEFLHYLYAWAHGYSGCLKWALTDHPLALSIEQLRYVPASDRAKHIEQGRFGLFWSDGTSTAQPKPLVPALRFLRDYVEDGGAAGQLTVRPAPNAIGTGYEYRAPGARFVGHQQYTGDGLEFSATHPANVLLRWDAETLRLVSTADAAVRLDLATLCGWPATERLVRGRHGGQRLVGRWLELAALAGEPVRVAR
ncbi:MAG: hypothetical protein IT204_12190 [Fimbriimonadaceae bacterium]|nr:hypothetical protein [Fimbriimonadaceae bacterium]